MTEVPQRDSDKVQETPVDRRVDTDEPQPAAATGSAARGGGMPVPVGVDEDAAGRRDDRALDEVYREGLDIEPRSLWKLAFRRFLRHKLAVGSLVVLVLVFMAGLFADTVAPYGFREQDLENALIGPALTDNHFFGTDPLGRDYFSRVVFGIKTTIRVAFVVAIVSTLIGTVMGALAGYFGGWLDNLLMRFTDLTLILPILPLLLVASAYLGEGSPFRVAIILGLLLWPSLARIVRGSFLSLKEKEFVEAARAVGASDRRIIFRHLLPNAMSPIIVNATLVVATAILIEAVLSFLGFGIKPPNPSLGSLVDDGRGFMLTAWWLVVFPGATIVVIALAINFIGDGLRDALDPTQRKTDE